MGLAVELEKPIALTYEESKEITKLAKVANIRLMIGMATHYRPEMVFASQQITAGVIGEIKTIHEETVLGINPFPLNYVAENNGGGVLLENGIHMLDHLLLWFGGPIDEMLSASVGSHFLGGLPRRYRHDSCRSRERRR
ncbi:MAG: Gfo/Idh/MocA family oxidoreductase [Candidatus Sungbacteria bacterium]|nr:Gfo/Idh/MocA family oxidoreductase [Candidatus Sungbacteria bacterium]